MSGAARRVAVFTECYLPYVSGVTVSVDALARGLVAHGREVLLVAPRAGNGAEPPAGATPGPDPEYAWLPAYELRGLAPRGYRMPLPRPSGALRAVQRFRPLVVHTHSPFVAGQLARRAAKRARAPLVFTHHTRFSEYRHYLGPIGRLGGRPLTSYLLGFWHRCDAVIAPSAELAAEIRARLEEAGDGSVPRVRAIPTGIDLAAVDRTAPEDVRALNGWPADAVVAVHLGRLAVEKSVDVVLDAFATASAQVPSLRLLFVGGGPAAARLERHAAAPDLAGRVAFAGAVPRQRAVALLRGSDLFVFASRTETQGLVLAEALACALPVVALSGPGVAETVRDGRDGVIVPATGGREDAVRLGGELARLAEDRVLRLAVASEARAGAERFSLAARVADVAELYDELLEDAA